MLISLIFTAYVTIVCWSFGMAILEFLKNYFRPDILLNSFSISCLIGLAFLGTIFTFFSLFLPLNHLGFHLLLILFSAFIGLKKIKKRWIELLFDFKVSSLFSNSYLLGFMLCSFLLVFIIHSYYITHPDTLNYHAQLIQWIEKFRVVPGIANLYPQYGLQSTWFILCGLFSFKFSGISTLTFVNIAVVLWLIFFIILKINHFLHSENNKKKHLSLPWLLLIIYCFVNYNYIRITASSASPDFIVAIYIWVILYLVTRLDSSSTSTLSVPIIIFFCFFVVSLKFSAAPCILLGLYVYYSKMKPRSMLKIIYPLLAGFFILSPILLRNFITSGYPFFPFPYGDIINFDWKLPKENLFQIIDYITAYARTGANNDPKSLNDALQIGVEEWVPIWWYLRSMADKILIFSIIIFTPFTIIFKWKSLIQNKFWFVSFIFAFVSIIFWFLQAPDPRFGMGYFIPLLGISIFLLFHRNYKIQIHRIIPNSIIFILTATICFYSYHRLSRYLTMENLFIPGVILENNFTKINCQGIDFHIPSQPGFCGGIEIPCANISCVDIKPRGPSLLDGFKSKKIL